MGPKLSAIIGWKIRLNFLLYDCTIVRTCNRKKPEVLVLRRASLFVFTSYSRRIEWPCRQNIWRFEQFRWNIRAIQEAPVRLWTQNYSCWLKDAKISLIFDLPAALWIFSFLSIYLFGCLYLLSYVTYWFFIPLLCLFIALFVCVYREFSPYANIITANFVTAVFQNYY